MPMAGTGATGTGAASAAAAEAGSLSASADGAVANASGSAADVAGALAGHGSRGADEPRRGVGSVPHPPATENRATDPVHAASRERGNAPGHAEAERIWLDAVRRLKQNPMIYGIVRGGRLASCENGQFTVVFDKGAGGMYVRLLSMEDKNALVVEALTAASGAPCTFRAALEGTVAEQDKGMLAAQAQAKKQAQDNLDRVFSAFGRENVRVLDDE